jgi:hypothetical protein
MPFITYWGGNDVKPVVVGERERQCGAYGTVVSAVALPSQHSYKTHRKKPTTQSNKRKKNYEKNQLNRRFLRDVQGIEAW